MVYPWYNHGIPMVCPWCTHEIPMVYPYYTYGIPIPNHTEADTADVALKILRIRDERVSQGKFVDRITERFTGRHEDSFRPLFVKHANGEGSDPSMMREIVSYQLCMIDDTAQEEPHAVLSKIVRARPRGNSASWFAMARMKQNIDAKRSLDREHPFRFGQLFRSWSRLFIAHSFTKKRHIAIKTVSKTHKFERLEKFAQKVYRTGGHAFLQTGLLSTHQKMFQETNCHTYCQALMDNTAKIQREYVLACVSDRSVYTLQQADPLQAIEDRPSGSSIGEGMGMPMVFEIVDKRAAAKSYVPTGGAVAFKSMRTPVMHQPLTFFQYSDTDTEEHRVFRVGWPSFIDLQSIGTWYDISLRLIEWKTDTINDDNGCTRIHSPLPCSAKIWQELQIFC